MSLLFSEYSFLRHPYPGLNLCHSSVHPLCSNLLSLQRSDLNLHIPTGDRSSVLFGSYAWPSHPLDPASSASQIGPNLGCVGLGDPQQSSRGCRWVYGMPQVVDSAATSAHLEEIGRCSPNLSQGLCCCPEQTVTEGQMRTVSLLIRLLGLSSESQVWFLFLLPYLFRTPCCHSLPLGLTFSIAGFVILPTNKLVFCGIFRLQSPSLWFCTINLFRRYSSACLCSSTVGTRYNILSILNTIVMTSLPEVLRLVLWFMSLWISASLYKTRRSLRSVRRHILTLAKTICLGKLILRNLRFGILGLQLGYVEHVNHGSVPFHPCCCWYRFMLSADFLLAMVVPLYVVLGLILVGCPATPFVPYLSCTASCIIYEEQHGSMCSLCRMYIVGQSSNRGWFVLFLPALGLVVWAAGIAVYATHGRASRSLAVFYLLCLTPTKITLLLSSLVLFLSWVWFCGVKPIEFGSQLSQWTENDYSGLILVQYSSTTFAQSLPLRPACVSYIAQHVAMCSMYRIYSGIVDHSAKGGQLLFTMRTLSSSLSGLWIKHFLFWGVPSVWLSLYQGSLCAQMLGSRCSSICWHWAFRLNGWDEVKGQYPLVYEDELSERSYLVSRPLTNIIGRLVWFPAAGFQTSHWLHDKWSENSIEAHGRVLFETHSSLLVKEFLMLICYLRLYYCPMYVLQRTECIMDDFVIVPFRYIISLDISCIRYFVSILEQHLRVLGPCLMALDKHLRMLGQVYAGPLYSSCLLLAKKWQFNLPRNAIWIIDQDLSSIEIHLELLFSLYFIASPFGGNLACMAIWSMLYDQVLNISAK